jgi:predicted RNase H-like HicB family nuclease
VIAGNESTGVPIGSLEAVTAKPGPTLSAGDDEALMRYSVVYEQGDTSWGAYNTDPPVCVAVRATRAEVENLIVEAIGAHLDDLHDSGRPVTPPRSANGLVDLALSRPLTSPGGRRTLP